MDSSDHRLRKEILDGQELIFPTVEGWECLRANPFLDGIPIAAPDLIMATVEWLRTAPEIDVGLALIEFARKPRWWPYEILTLNGQKYRVHAEMLECDSCHWRGITATASLSDSYVGCPNEEELRERGYTLPIISCPRCGGKLPPRCPVWAKYEESHEA